MKPLDPRSKEATLLHRYYTGAGFCAGPEFPGDTIRKAIDSLYLRGYLQGHERVSVSEAGKAWLSAHHLEIKP